MRGTSEAAALLQRELGNWWLDDRRHWCAYCGIPMRRRFGPGRTLPNTKATRDHVVPKAHGSGGLTIPACLGCNRSKGALSLAEFLCSSHFAEVRRQRHRNKWSVRDLWLASALASLQQAEKVTDPNDVARA
jgi:5-methylcytosine-specific restriction endonuclease McrA